MIDIRRIGQHRPAGATGIYGPDGNLDDTVWARYRAAFLSVAPEGTLSVEETRRVFSRLGRIPARQFESLYAVCARMNGAPKVTLEQLEWLYDGSLLYRAAERIKAGR